MTQWEVLANHLSFSSEKEMWDTLYIKRNMSISHLANRFAASPHTIRARLAACGISSKPRGGKNNQKVEITDELIAEIKRDGVLPVAKRLGVVPQTLYKRVYYARGIKLRQQGQQAASAALKAPHEEDPPSSNDPPKR